MPPKQWIPVRFGARVQQIWRFMKREELKRDPVADKIVKAVKYFQDNKIMVFIIFLILFSTIIGISWTVNAKDNEDSDAKIAIDEVMIELINTGLNDSNYFKTKFKIQLTNLKFINQKQHPKSKIQRRKSTFESQHQNQKSKSKAQNRKSKSNIQNIRPKSQIQSPPSKLNLQNPKPEELFCSWQWSWPGNIFFQNNYRKQSFSNITKRVQQLK